MEKERVLSTGFPNLPLELVEEIGIYLTVSELANLRLTSRYFSRALQAILFHTVELSLEKLPAPVRLDERSFGAQCIDAFWHIADCVKHLVLTSTDSPPTVKLGALLAGGGSIHTVLAGLKSLREVSMRVFVDDSKHANLEVALRTLQKHLRGRPFNAIFSYSSYFGRDSMATVNFGLVRFLPAETISLEINAEPPGIHGRGGRMAAMDLKGLKQLKCLRLMTEGARDTWDFVLEMSFLKDLRFLRVLEITSIGFVQSENIAPLSQLEELSIWTQCLFNPSLNINAYATFPDLGAFAAPIRMLKTNRVDDSLFSYLRSCCVAAHLTVLELYLETDCSNWPIDRSIADFDETTRMLAQEFTSNVLPSIRERITDLTVTVWSPTFFPRCLSTYSTFPFRVWWLARAMAKAWSFIQLPQSCIFTRLRRFSGCLDDGDGRLSVENLARTMPAVGELYLKLFAGTPCDVEPNARLAEKYIDFSRRNAKRSLYRVEVNMMCLESIGFVTSRQEKYVISKCFAELVEMPVEQNYSTAVGI